MGKSLTCLFYIMAMIILAGHLSLIMSDTALAADSVGLPSKQPNLYPAFNTPQAKPLSHDEYMTEAENVFAVHLCPSLKELTDTSDSREENAQESIIIIAIIDSGIDPLHPELMVRLVPGYNFRSRNTDTRDHHGHGTKVAGIAALASDPGCATDLNGRIMLMPLVIASGRGEAKPRILAEAIRYAADKGARIINVSYGGIADRKELQEAVDYAWEKGSIIFAAAGNDYHGHPAFPAACSNVVAVTGIGLNSSRASFANYGDWIDLAADSTLVPTTTMGGGYAAVNGTSFAAPVAAGLGALLLLVNPDLSNTQLVEILTRYAEDLGDPGFDSNYGFGRISPGKSLKAAMTIPGRQHSMLQKSSDHIEKSKPLEQRAGNFDGLGACRAESEKIFVK